MPAIQLNWHIETIDSRPPLAEYRGGVARLPTSGEDAGVILFNTFPPFILDWKGAREGASEAVRSCKGD